MTPVIYSDLFIQPLKIFKQKLLFWLNAIVAFLLIGYGAFTISLNGNFPYPLRDWIVNSLYVSAMVLMCVYHYRCVYLHIKPSPLEDWITMTTTFVCFIGSPIINVHIDLNRPISFLWSGSIGILVIFALTTLSTWRVGLATTFLMIANMAVAAQRLGWDYIYHIEGYKDIELRFYFAQWVIVYTLGYAISLITSAMLNQLHQLIPRAVDVMVRYEKTQQDLTSEFNAAQKVQVSLHPKKENVEHRLYDAYGFNKPAGQLSSDYFDLFVIGERLYFGIGDVSGHGIAGSYIANSARLLFTTYINLGVIDIPRILEQINCEINQRRHDSQRLMNMSLVLGYIENDELHLWGRHEQILHLHGMSSVSIINTHQHGTLLGVKDSILADIKELVIPLREQELILFYTDGATEHENHDQKPYGVERLQWMLTDGIYQAFSQPSKQIVKSILEDLHAWHPELKDDTTLLAIRRKPQDR